MNNRLHGAALRARLIALARLPLPRLRKEYEAALSKPPGDLGKDALIKALAERPATPLSKAPTATPEPKPAREEPKPKRVAPAPRPRKPRERNPRLPPIGGVIEKTFRGTAIRVEVTADGFAYDAKPWPSLTALALHLTGYPAVSGPAFFGLTQTRPAAAQVPMRRTKGG